MRLLFVALAVASLVTLPLEAQRSRREPRRPRLQSSADTNDANAYLSHGHRIVEDNAAAAADAYYWAMRIDPGNADALYGYRTAVLMRRQSTFFQYMEGNRRTIFSPEMRANDSLYYRALQIDPFLHERHARTLIFTYYRKAIASGYSTGEIDAYVQQRLNASPPSVRARMAMASGQVAFAHDLFTEAIGQAKDPSFLFIERGRVNALQGRNDDAIADFSSALERMAQDEDKKDEEVIFYSSKALHHYSVGLLQVRKGAKDKAREALGNAMTEDLAFYPAHVELSRLALIDHDTATAVSEMALAAELAPTEAHVLLKQGQLLLVVGQHAEALVPLRKAVDLEPYYAEPHHAIGVALEQAGDAVGAKVAYERFLALAARRHALRADATNRLRGIGGTQ